MRAIESRKIAQSSIIKNNQEEYDVVHKEIKRVREKGKFSFRRVVSEPVCGILSREGYRITESTPVNFHRIAWW